MTGLWRVRPARMEDLPAVLELARLTGGGFTNLPMDETALARRLAWSDASFARADAAPENELYLLLLEEVATAASAAPAWCSAALARNGRFTATRSPR